MSEVDQMENILQHSSIEIHISVAVTMQMGQQLFYFNPRAGAARAFSDSVTANRLNFCQEHATHWSVIRES